MTAATQTFRLQHYDLTCSALVCDNGRYRPALVVARNVWPSRPRTISMERSTHPTPDVAIAAAHAQGLEWVRNYG